MNRDILFRSKGIDNQKWVFGDLEQPSSVYFNPKICYWYEEQPGIFKRIEIEVDPETVGQFTGLLDKNGTKIFEGDVLENNNSEDGVIVWTDERARFELHGENKKGNEVWFSIDTKFVHYKEVTGNIHETK